MTRKQLKQLLDDNLEIYKEKVGVVHWDVGIELTELPCDFEAEVRRQEDYRTAHIRFDPSKLCKKSETYVLNILRHELIHLLLAPFDVYGSIVETFIRNYDDVKAADLRAYTHAQEQAVWNIEKLLDLHGVT